jgi:uncharacterized protein (DUF1800 family)
MGDSDRIEARGSIGRRSILALGATASLAPFVGGCDRISAALRGMLGAPLPLPERFGPPENADDERLHRLLSRAGFGPKPGDLERAWRIGPASWVDSQLEPGTIEDTACDFRAGAVDAAHLDAGLAFELPPEQLEEQLGAHAILRAVYSERQLLEVMVEHWSDHFHVAIGKSLARHLKLVDDREVARAHALGRFRDLLGASVLSPAMLVYLDGRENRVERAGDAPNENHARELLELHTLGVDGGYTQTDVMEVARCLTGFVVREDGAPGTVEFVAERHDDGPKRVLGQDLPAGGGRADVDRLLDLLAAHPSTARYVARGLCRSLVGGDVPASRVASAAATFSATGGDLRAVVRTILLDEELLAAGASRIKRPFRFVVSALRAFNAQTNGRAPLAAWLGRMGHRPYAWATPDGYPRDGGDWLHTLATRFRFASELVRGGIEGTRIDAEALARAVSGGAPRARLAAHAFGRPPTDAERAVVDAAPSLHAALALVVASPGFQRFA